jgi:hypothetical protein
MKKVSGVVVYARRATTSIMLPKRDASLQDQFAAVNRIGGQGIKPQ